MSNKKLSRYAGVAGIIGGIMGVILAPIMVAIKYLTGWSVIPKPAWINKLDPVLQPILSFDTPQILWTTYGAVYTIALILMLIGFFALRHYLIAGSTKVLRTGYWILIAGLCLVISGDSVHSITWHQNGLKIPTPGSNPVANTGYAVAMMGMNFILIGSIMIGVSALRKKSLLPWVSCLFILITPFAVILSLTILPTTPGGGLWWFSIMMIIFGFLVAKERFIFRNHSE